MHPVRSAKLDVVSSEPHELPVIACTLGSGELAEREQRWAALVRTAGSGRRAMADGVELRFRADAQVEHELRELVAGERECCAWARWELEHEHGGGLVMHAHATERGIATLQSMFLRDA